ncbi:hypothetical protein JG688_00007165 [Phytophthora aleatoria]|uniref:Uncharacterized protein n=1 Tax=Phytophthora aleatoria TaxID=2496075 RepID=A0A8J5ILT4_9STRA|nr:hypothetical protein JG688_00007165 [Phytophthora aleatoria]
MAQISPRAALDEVTVVVFPSKDDNMNKTELVDKRPSLKYKIFLGLLYTLASCGFLYGCVAAVTFFGDIVSAVYARHAVVVTKAQQIVDQDQSFHPLSNLPSSAYVSRSTSSSITMAIQVMPLPASDEVTVTIRNEENPKDEKPAETRTLQQNIFLGILSMIVLIGALCLFIVAVEYINEGFIRLLAVAQRQHRLL